MTLPPNQFIAFVLSAPPEAWYRPLVGSLGVFHETPDADDSVVWINQGKMLGVFSASLHRLPEAHTAVALRMYEFFSVPTEQYSQLYLKALNHCVNDTDLLSVVYAADSLLEYLNILVSSHPDYQGVI